MSDSVLIPTGMPMFRPCDICAAAYRTTVAGIWYPLFPEGDIKLMPAVLICSGCM